MASLNRQYDAIIGWSELYDGASIETKKMIVNCLIMIIGWRKQSLLRLFSLPNDTFGSE